MCEYCHWVFGHHPRCPNAPEPKVRGCCKQCGDQLREEGIESDDPLLKKEENKYGN